jgi:hypothetical protein
MHSHVDSLRYSVPSESLRAASLTEDEELRNYARGVVGIVSSMAIVTTAAALPVFERGVG